VIQVRFGVLILCVVVSFSWSWSWVIGESDSEAKDGVKSGADVGGVSRPSSSVDQSLMMSLVLPLRVYMSSGEVFKF
jgi:hypothetical protein